MRPLERSRKQRKPERATPPADELPLLRAPPPKCAAAARVA
jgi:hypothetical protein